MPHTHLGPLHVQREVHGLSIVVRAAGEVDESTVLPLRTELQTALAMATPPHPVVADLSAVRFFGSAGLNELMRHHRSAEAAGIPFRIAAAHKAVLRPITMTGLGDVLRIFPDVEQALAADRGAWTAC